MVFSSLPVYNLDPPNWPQQHQEATSGGGGGGNNQNSQLPPLPLHGGGGGGGGGGGSIRPGFMVDRARLAKIPPPEPSQKCPRCDSTNTKFCYYNNYNLSQPRHFCKTCRRYWTKGGALRNVPVGGGCRRNKKNKSGNSSKSAPASTTTTTSSSAINSSEISGNVLPQQNTHLPFMSSLPNLSQYGNLGNMGFNFGGLTGGSSTSVGGANGNPENSGFQTNSVGVHHPHHHQQQQFSNFLEAASAGLYPFPGSEGIEGSSSARVSQLASVKMENNNLGLGGVQNLTRPMFFGNFDNNNNISSGNNNNDNNNNSRNHFWGGNNWSTGTGL